MLQYERFETILNTLKQQPTVRVADLSRDLGVSQSTVRRDIADLHREGKLRKVFGGAVSVTSSQKEKEEPFSKVQFKENIKAEEKSEVAAYAASLIQDGELIYIDAGTTTGSMIDQISCYGATYVTDGIMHGLRLAERGFKTYLVAGHVKASTEAITGHEAVRSLEKYHFDKAFIGTDGVDLDNGLTTAGIEESMVKTEAIDRSGKVYILADSSKFGLVSAITFAGLESGTIITDKLPDPAYLSTTEIIELN